MFQQDFCNYRQISELKGEVCEFYTTKLNYTPSSVIGSLDR